MTWRERLVIGGTGLLVVAYLVGSHLDDALGHDATSLAIALGAVFLIFLVGGPIVARWALRGKQ